MQVDLFVLMPLFTTLASAPVAHSARSPIELMQHMVAGTMNGSPAPPIPAGINGGMMMMNVRPTAYRTPPIGQNTLMHSVMPDPQGVHED
uniref:Secreted protein n=1 Tax=Heterorhabditis bacteriophora TaxID=37862 RepID=A0A1I7WQG8_HETBA